MTVKISTILFPECQNIHHKLHRFIEKNQHTNISKEELEDIFYRNNPQILLYEILIIIESNPKILKQFLKEIKRTIFNPQRIMKGIINKVSFGFKVIVSNIINIPLINPGVSMLQSKVCKSFDNLDEDTALTILATYYILTGSGEIKEHHLSKRQKNRLDSMGELLGLPNENITVDQVTINITEIKNFSFKYIYLRLNKALPGIFSQIDT